MAATHSAHSGHGTLRHTLGKVGVSTHDHVHESHWVLLDGCVDGRVVLLQARHELLVKLWILAHALCHVSELWVLHEAHQLSATRWHCTSSGHHTWVAHARVFLAIIVTTVVTTGRDLVQVDSLQEQSAGKVSVAAGKRNSLDALVTWLACNGE